MIVHTQIFSATALGRPRRFAYGSTPNWYAARNATAYMTPYQWMGRGPRFRTGSTLMVMKPTWPGLTGTALMMRSCGGRMHLEDPIAAFRSDPFDAMAEPRQPRGHRVGTEMALNHQMRGCARFQPPDPDEEQLVERLLAEPDRRVGVDGGELDAAGDGVRFGGDDVACARTLCVARTQVEGAAVDVNRPDPGVRVAQCHGDGDCAVSTADVDHLTRGDRRQASEQEIGTEIEVTVRKDTPVGIQLEAPVWEGDPDRPRARSDLRIRAEVVILAHRRRVVGCAGEHVRRGRRRPRRRRCGDHLPAGTARGQRCGDRSILTTAHLRLDPRGHAYHPRGDRRGRGVYAAGSALPRDLARARGRNRPAAAHPVRWADPRVGRRRGCGTPPSRVPGQHHRLRESIRGQTRAAQRRRRGRPVPAVRVGW